ncbi:MAG: hypothetical protein EOM28_12720 [Clostridia bacterium]|nr:hypothetical protein [Clostridia bacterium]
MKKFKWKINGDTMTTIVVSSLIFCAVIVVWGMVQAQHGVDSSAIVDSALRIFGTELGICGVMTIFKRWSDAQDKRLEYRREKERGKHNE